MKHRPTYQRHDLIGTGADATAIRRGLGHLYKSLARLSPDDWNMPTLEGAIRNTSDEESIPMATFNKVARVALGAPARSSVPGAMQKMGQQASLARIQVAIDMLSVVADAQ